MVAVVDSTKLRSGLRLEVSGVGRGDPLGDGYTDYASMGSYTITGSVIGGDGPDRFSIAENPASGAAVGTVAPLDCPVGRRTGPDPGPMSPGR